MCSEVECLIYLYKRFVRCAHSRLYRLAKGRLESVPHDFQAFLSAYQQVDPKEFDINKLIKDAKSCTSFIDDLERYALLAKMDFPVVVATPPPTVEQISGFMRIPPSAPKKSVFDKVVSDNSFVVDDDEDVEYYDRNDPEYDKSVKRTIKRAARPSRAVKRLTFIHDSEDEDSVGSIDLEHDEDDVNLEEAKLFLHQLRCYPPTSIVTDQFLRQFMDKLDVIRNSMGVGATECKDLFDKIIETCLLGFPVKFTKMNWVQCKCHMCGMTRRCTFQMLVKDVPYAMGVNCKDLASSLVNLFTTMHNDRNVQTDDEIRKAVVRWRKAMDNVSWAHAKK